MAETLADLIARKSVEIEASGFFKWAYRTPEEVKAMADGEKYYRRSHLSDGEVDDMLAEITRLRSDNQKLREALEISLWFGPSDFFRARAALAEGNSNG